MTRPATPADADAVLALGLASGLFPDEAVEFVRGQFTGSLDGTLGPGHHWWVLGDGTGPDAVAFVAPERLTEGTSNLLMIAVRPDVQGRGMGSDLIRHVERELRERGERILLVDTSGTTAFDRTRSFYRRNGYEQEARIRDYYKDGDDKITYRKVLKPETKTA